WEHTVVLEKILPADPKINYPCCIAGKRNGPPDDVGGVFGYEEFLSIMKDPQHEEHDEMVEWYGDIYDPEEFDCAEVVFNDPDAWLSLMGE
ncbi:MAG: plasmid pRiA4b ORF-3 family protein, partial [Methanoregula sp.]|nr:plasmid pRiA4b ORF-3 family protein [Methanoregula sp.]